MTTSHLLYKALPLNKISIQKDSEGRCYHQISTLADTYLNAGWEVDFYIGARESYSSDYMFLGRLHASHKGEVFKGFDVFYLKDFANRNSPYSFQYFFDALSCRNTLVFLDDEYGRYIDIFGLKLADLRLDMHTPDDFEIFTNYFEVESLLDSLAVRVGNDCEWYRWGWEEYIVFDSLKNTKYLGIYELSQLLNIGINQIDCFLLLDCFFHENLDLLLSDGNYDYWCLSEGRLIVKYAHRDESYTLNDIVKALTKTNKYQKHKDEYLKQINT